MTEEIRIPKALAEALLNAPGNVNVLGDLKRCLDQQVQAEKDKEVSE